MRTLWRRFVAVFRAKRLDAELAAEVALHLELLEQEHRAHGMSPEDARCAARRDFGGVTQTQERYRDRRGLPFIENSWRDLRYAARMLAKNPGFTAVAAITLALGIGANTTMFSALNALVLRPLPLEDPDRLVMITEAMEKGPGRTLGRRPTVASSTEWKQLTRTFATIERGELSGGPATLAGIGRAERVSQAACTPGFLAMLGARPILGRTFVTGDVQGGRAVATVISAELWRRSFDADPEILGKTVAIEGFPYTIVGVLPPGFSVTPWDARVDLWLSTDPSRNSGTRWMPVMGRLKPGVTAEQAAAELTGFAQGRPGWEPGWTVQLEDLHGALVHNRSPFFTLPFFAVGCVLLIACVNVANLLLARGAARGKEMAVRASLGAGRWRLVRQLLVETVLLSLVGGVLGVFVGMFGTRLYRAFAPSEAIRYLPMTVDFRVLGFTLGLALLTGILFGLMPAIRASRPDLHGTLKEGAPGAGASSQRSQNVLQVIETALAVMLLVEAALLVQDFLRLRNTELGYNPRRVLRADVLLAGPKYLEVPGGLMKNVTPHGDWFFQQAMERIGAIPGAVAVGTSHLAPPDDVQMRSFRVIGRSEPPAHARFNEVGGAFFQALGIPLLRGRYVNDRDDVGTPWVMNVNQTFVKRYFPNEDPIGKMVRITLLGLATNVNVEEERPRQIIGVVGDVAHFGPGPAYEPVMYASSRQHLTTYPGGLYIGHLWKSITVRTAGDPLSVAAAVQKAVAEVDKDQAVFGIQTLEQGLADRMRGPAFPMRLFATFAAVALILAAVGIYGVTAYLVAGRTHEIGVRVALGACGGDVIRMVIGRGLLVTSLGLVVGIVGSMLLTMVTGRFMFGIRAAPPLTYGLVSLVLLAVALAACWLPARRALTIDPLMALRHE